MGRTPSFDHAPSRLWLPYALVGVVAAQVTMLVVAAQRYNHDGYLAGLGLCGVLAGLVGAAGTHASALDRRTWTLAGGAVAGAAVLTIVSWSSIAHLASIGDVGALIFVVMTGAALGILPALLIVVIDVVSTALGGPVPAADARERAMMPFAATCALAGGLLASFIDEWDRWIPLGIMALALASLIEIQWRDHRRSRYLQRVLRGDEPDHALSSLVAPRTDVPLAVGGVTPDHLVLKCAEANNYRDAAQIPLFQTTHSARRAVAPLRRRTRQILVVQLIALVTCALPEIGRALSGDHLDREVEQSHGTRL